MCNSISLAEGEPIGVAGSRWLRVARYSAMTCAIVLVLGFLAEAAAHDLWATLIMFSRWTALSVVLLYLLFRQKEDAGAFALGLGTATAFIALLAVACTELSRPSDTLRHVLFVLAFFGGVLPPFAGMLSESNSQLATLGALLLWLFSISSAVLGLSSIAAFQKMVHEKEGAGKLRFIFWAGIFCGPAVWLIFTLLWLSLVGGFHI